MIRKEKFVPGQYYHIYSRVILNAPEFKDKKNAERLALNFWIANSTKSDEIFRYLGSIRNRSVISHDKILKMLNHGERIVDVLCYVIMPDHYHLLLRERKERGINNFIHKCNTSVAKYINIKNNRRGPLFENRFQSKHINANDYLLHLSLYIHLNPLDFLVGRVWREHKIKNWTSAREKLFNYPWSSLKTYLNDNDDNYRNYIISGTKVIENQFDTKNNYESFLRRWSGDQFNAIYDIITD